MRRLLRARVRLLVVFSVLMTVALPARADEIWVAPTLQQDAGGLGIGSNTYWPVTMRGLSRFAWGIPNNLQIFQNARIVLVPHAPGGAATLNVIVCAAQNGQPVAGSCAGPFAHAFTGVVNQLLEINITADLAAKIGTPGLNNLAVLAYTAPTSNTDHLLSLRFTFRPNVPVGAATLSANTFTGTQTAPAFVGDGAGLSNVGATLLDGLDSTAFALTVHGHDVSQITSAAKLTGGNAFSGTQSIAGGNLDLDFPSSAGTGTINKGGVRFLYETGGNNTFLGRGAGTFALSGLHNTAVGTVALANIASGTANTALGSAALTNTTGGGANTATGASALYNNVSGSGNTAVGEQALFSNSTGGANLALGHLAGSSATIGSNNIYLGANVAGIAGESNTMHLGLVGTQTKTFIAGVRGVTTGAPDAIPVVIDSNGQLGTSPSAIATLGANTFSGTQTAPAFVGDGSGLTNLPAPGNVATLGANTFTGTQTAPAFAGDGTGITNVNASSLDGLDSTAFATLGGNTFTGTQVINSGNLLLSSAGMIAKNGLRFLHNLGGANSTSVGLSAGNPLSTGDSNTAVGYGALSLNTLGSQNTAVGESALNFNNTGISNTALGFYALQQNTSGGSNTATGHFSLSNSRTGSANTADGYGVLSSNISGAGNAAVGHSALHQNTTGHFNTALGYGAGLFATTGSSNIYLGADVRGVADESNAIYLGNQGTQTKTVIAGIRGTAVAGGEIVVIDPVGRLGSTSTSGFATLGANSFSGTQTAPAFAGNGSSLTDVNAALLDGLDSSAFALAAHGHDVSQIANAARLAGGNALTGTQTIDSGNLDLDTSTNTTGVITKNGVRFIHDAGPRNAFVGVLTGNLSLTGAQNTAVGYEALQLVTSASNNLAAGYHALQNNTSGDANTAVGVASLVSNSTGNSNTAVGGGALFDNTNGSYNVAAGHSALQNNSTGNFNTAVGAQAIEANTNGVYNVAVGYNAGFLSSGSHGSNNTYIGSLVQGQPGESNTMRLGRAGVQNSVFVAGVRGNSVAGGEMVVIDANGRLGSTPVSGPGANTVGSAEVIDDSLTASDLGPDSVGNSEVSFNYAASTSKGGPAADVACTACIAAGEVSFTFAGSGANAFTGTQDITSGNLDLDDSTAATGVVTKNGQPFLHNFGTQNTFVGVGAGNFVMTGFGNTASGRQALRLNTTGVGNTATGSGALASNTTGGLNTATGIGALQLNTTGNNNTATGRNALIANTTGSENTATGLQALMFNTTACCNTATGNDALRENTVGIYNTATGHSALYFNTTGTQNTANGTSALQSNVSGTGNTANGFAALLFNTGSNNVGVGLSAGANATIGSGNIYLGANVVGVAGESNTMYLGQVGTQTKTIVAGIRGTTTVNPDAIAVVIDSAGQLGTVSSSRRFKEDIHDMADASDRLFKLHPVTFRYTQPYGNGSKPIQFGLIAEEVAEVFPELAVRGADGEIETVHYETLNVLLLNEVQRQQREIEEARERIAKLEQKLDALLQAIR